MSNSSVWFAVWSVFSDAPIFYQTSDQTVSRQSEDLPFICSGLQVSGDLSDTVCLMAKSACLSGGVCL